MFDGLIDTKSFKEINKLFKSCPTKHNIAEMSFKEIKAIAATGRTEEYNIKIGDTIKVNNSINAKIISIGDDYIEFCTIQKIVDSDEYPDNVSVDGSNVEYNAISSFYAGPQVNNGKTNTTQISYVGSNIQSKVNAWLDAQSDEFKSSLKEVKREYEVATLTFDDNKNYSQTITGTITDIEKVYIPTKSELEDIRVISDDRNLNYFWTATPCCLVLAAASYVYYSFGRFFFYNHKIHNGSGCYNVGSIALFRVG